VYFTELLEHLCVDGPTNHLDRVDKFCILLGLRIICVNPTLEMQFTCSKTENKFTYKLDLIKILQEIADLEGLYSNNTIVVDSNITIELGFPAQFIYSNQEDIVFECISTVNIKDKSFNIKVLNEIEKENILSLLPGTITNDVYDYIIEKQKILNDIIFMDVKSPFDPDGDAIIVPFDGINNTFLEILKGIYGINMNEIYDLIYFLTTKLKFTGDYIENNMTFAEAVIYLNKYTTELKEREKAEQKGSTGASQGPIPMPMQVPYTGIE
jgi:hypothetical protein